MAVTLPQSFRDERWAVFEHALRDWLETNEGRFAAYCAERDRDERGLRAAHPPKPPERWNR